EQQHHQGRGRSTCQKMSPATSHEPNDGEDVMERAGLSAELELQSTGVRRPSQASGKKINRRVCRRENAANVITQISPAMMNAETTCDEAGMAGNIVVAAELLARHYGRRDGKRPLGESFTPCSDLC